MAIDNKAIGQRIRKEREKFGLSREELAEIVGLSDYYVGQLERGERQMSLPVLVKLAECLHMSLDYLIWGEISRSASYVCETPNPDDANDYCKDAELARLLRNCSLKELELVRKLLKTILPYMNI